jgi:ABC-2 type transport system permease protein
MSTLRSLLPPQAPRPAFVELVKDEFRLMVRTPTALIVGMGLPLLLLLIYGIVPAMNQSSPSLGGLTYFQTAFPVLIAFVLVVLGVGGLPGPLATYREQGILRRLSTTPVPPAWVLAAQLVVNCAVAVLAIVILLVAGMGIFGIAVPKSVVGLVLALLLSIPAIFVLGLFIAAVASGATSAQALGGATFFPLLFFAGLWLPQASMPAVLRNISQWTPLGAAVEAIQSALQTGFPPVTSLLALMAYVVAFGWLAVRFFRWE